MALKLFRRLSKKAPKAPKAEQKKDTKVVEDKVPEDAVKVERVAMPPVDKQETIDEEGDVATVESTGEEAPPAQDENENSDPATEKSDGPAESAKDMETSEEQNDKAESNVFACCQGSPADVLKNLQAAVGMA